MSIENPSQEQRDTIGRLNDELRRKPHGRTVFVGDIGAWLGRGARNDIHKTALQIARQRAILAAVAACVPSAGNDPYGERDFSPIECEGEKIYWKITYFLAGSDKQYGADEPWVAEKTERLLTIMLASDY